MYIASVFAQLEREVTAERIRDNMVELAKEGRWLGGLPPLGYEKESYKVVNVLEETENNVIEKKQKTACKLIEDKETSDTIRLIFKKYMEFKSLTKLEKYLYQNDIKTRTGAYFNAYSLRNILTNPVYSTNSSEAIEYFTNKGITVYSDRNKPEDEGKYGLIAYNKTKGKLGIPRPIEEWIVAIGLHKGIIEGIDWARVQDLIEKNSDKKYRCNNTSNAILSGLIKCKDCGTYMRPKFTSDNSKSGKVKRYYYTCVKKDKSRGTKCQAENVNGLLADKMVMEVLKSTFVPNSEVYKELKKMAMAKSTDEKNSELELLEKEYQKNSNEIKSLIEKLKYLDISVIDFVNDELKRLKEKNEKLEEKISRLQSNDIVKEHEEMKMQKGAELVLEIVDNCFSIFDNFDIKFKKDILRILIENIKGTKNELEVNFLNTKLEESKKKLFVDAVKAEKNSEIGDTFNQIGGDVTKKL